MAVSSKIILACIICRTLCWEGGADGAPVNPAQTAPEISHPYTISLNVDWVILAVTVSDRRGGFISALAKNHFTVCEDGRPQEIQLFEHEAVPLTIGLVIDSSGSMRNKRSYVTAAALAFVRSLKAQDEVFIVNFNDKAQLGLQSDQGFTNNLEQVRLALSRSVSVGRTALHDAIGLALDQLSKGHHDKKALLLISDGGDNASQLRFDQVFRKAKESQAIIYAISLFDEQNADQNPKLLKRLARISGGQFFSPSSLAELETVCQKISQDLRHQYTLGYVPSNQAHDGAFRTIRVKVNTPHSGSYSVRTREGYLAPQAEEQRTAQTPGQ
jgi:Ca-activated chloride channel family protein